MNFTAVELNEEIAESLYFNTVLLTIYLILGLFGNSLVLYVYTRRMKRTEERYFIPVLATADIFACLAGVILGLVSNFYRANYVLETFCKMGYFLTWSTTSVSGIIILLIALNRHLMICRPTSPQLTIARKKRAIVAVIVFSVVSSGPMLYFLGKKNMPFKYKGQNINTTLCSLRFSDGIMFKLQLGYFAFEIILAFLNMLITCGLYIPVGVKIYQRFKLASYKARLARERQEASTVQTDLPTTVMPHTARMDNSEVEESTLSTIMSSVNSSSMDSKTCCICKKSSKADIKKDVRDTSIIRRKKARRKQMKHNFTMMFATIIIFYIMAYLPTLVVLMVSAKNPAEFYFSKSPAMLNVLVFLQRAFLLNNIINAFIYSYFDLSFRKEAKKLLCCFYNF